MHTITSENLNHEITVRIILIRKKMYCPEYNLTICAIVPQLACLKIIIQSKLKKFK